MNITAIHTLAETLENLPPEKKVGFNMGTYHHDLASDFGPMETNVGHQCGTVACIAGWASMFLREDGTGLLQRPRREIDIPAFDDLGAHLLGLDENQANSLFEPMNYEFENADIDWGQITPAQAAKVLRHLAATGEVDWSIVLPE